MVASISLSKSKYLAGCQCPKRLYQSSRNQKLARPPEAAQQAIFDLGHEVGLRARELFPAGVPISEAADQHDRAVEQTRRLLRDPAVGALFEAAFVHDGVRIRVDVLERLSGGRWGLREVKATTRVKPIHLTDCAFQRFVLEASGASVASIELIHVDREFVRGPDGVDWHRFFVREDVTDRIDAESAQVGLRIAEMQKIVAADEVPCVEPSRHCFDPHECEFWDHCTRDKPDDWIFYLPRLRAGRFDQLRAEGVVRVPDIPESFPLSEIQRRIRQVLRSERTFVAPELRSALEGIGPPVAYLDFETMTPAIPFYPRTRPYQRIPFQWSLHQLAAGGRLAHREFLAEGDVDPRREFAETLLAALPRRSDGEDWTPIVVYSPFESSVLSDLAAHLTDLAPAIQGIRGRLVDLLPIVRCHVYHRDFDFSYSIKNVVPALSSGFGYDDLEGVSDGGSAAAAFTSIIARPLDTANTARVRRQLLAYCARDTQALVELHRALLARCSDERDS